jgi:DNA-binding transcriptional MerR regulator
MSELDIGEVARQSGLPASTLRFYEEKGLIAPVRRSGQRRVYAAKVLERLALIALGRTAGFSLDEIGKMLTPQGAHIDRALLLAKADELERTIKQLSAVRDGLRHAAECRAPSHMECPTFQRIVQAAAQSARRGADTRVQVPRRAAKPAQKMF